MSTVCTVIHAGLVLLSWQHTSVHHVWGFKHCSAIKRDYFLFRGKWAHVTQTGTFHADVTPEKNICTFEMILRRIIMTDSCNAHG